jgi:hypothetical protein
MKLEDFSNLYFVVSVLVPGFIYSGVVANFIPLRRSKEKEVLLLRYLTATAFNYAICSPLIYLLTFGLIFSTRPIWQAFCWFAIVFVVPVILAACHARIIQKDGLGWFYRLLGLRPISPIPTGSGQSGEHRIASHHVTAGAGRQGRTERDGWVPVASGKRKRTTKTQRTRRSIANAVRGRGFSSESL